MNKFTTLFLGTAVCMSGLSMVGCDKKDDTTMPPAVSNAASSSEHQDAKDKMSSAGDSMKDAGSSMKDAASKTGDAIKSDMSAAKDKMDASTPSTMPSMATPTTMP